MKCENAKFVHLHYDSVELFNGSCNDSMITGIAFGKCISMEAASDYSYTYFQYSVYHYFKIIITVVNFSDTSKQTTVVYK